MAAVAIKKKRRSALRTVLTVEMFAQRARGDRGEIRGRSARTLIRSQMLSVHLPSCHRSLVTILGAIDGRNRADPWHGGGGGLECDGVGSKSRPVWPRS